MCTVYTVHCTQCTLYNVACLYKSKCLSVCGGVCGGEGEGEGALDIDYSVQGSGVCMVTSRQCTIMFPQQYVNSTVYKLLSSPKYIIRVHAI